MLKIHEVVQPKPYQPDRQSRPCFIVLANFVYYGGIMLNIFVTLLCSKLCWPIRLKPMHQIDW